MSKVGRNIITQDPNANIVYKRRERENPMASGEQHLDRRDEMVKNSRNYEEAIIYTSIDYDEHINQESGEEGKEDTYKVALADFYNAPSIDEVDLSEYHGLIGDKITVRAVDDFAVDSVYIVIINADNSKLEEGYAKLAKDNIDWVYIATKDNSLLKHNRIIIRATDLPGNTIEKEEGLW